MAMFVHLTSAADAPRIRRSRIRTAPQVVGWRYRPGSHGTRPCTCTGGRGR
ncbi:hypothetical protein [Kitasatospora setae]|uniref:hypothetical protein n=1 Tax=Kitasatospora setae TaxID=2066 RepID=UPI00031DC88D